MIARLVTFLFDTGHVDYAIAIEETFADYKTLTYNRLLLGISGLPILLCYIICIPLGTLVPSGIFKKISNLLDNNIFK